MSVLQKARTKAVEVGVYLPLGAFDRARDNVADFDTKKVKKLYGQFVSRGEDRLAPVERRFRREVRDARNSAEETVKDARSTAKRTATKAKRTTKTAESRAKQTVRKTTSKTQAAANQVAPRVPRVAAPKSASELPIARYDSLTAEEITSRLKGLTQTDLAKVYKYEKANEDRATIVSTIEPRFTVLPIPTYDALNVDEINGRLEGLGDRELKAIRSYEKDTKARQTVLDKIEVELNK